MKRLEILAVFLLVSQLAMCQKTFDQNLFGSWEGSEKDNQKKNLEKHWIMHRFENGNFVLLFTMIEDGAVDSFSETGKWWIENGQFHEYHNNTKLTDVYSYQMLDPEHVKFKAKSLSLDHDNQQYEFIDTKIVENNL